MAIINTLDKCLDSPYLQRDPEAPAQVPALLAFATERLDLVQNLLSGTAQGDPADPTYLSYEAMFACVRALVYAQGYREAGLRCLLIACNHLYVQPGRLDPDLLLAFEQAQALKLSPADAASAATTFLARTRDLLTPTP